MSLFIVNQEANANFLVRRARDFKRFSITSVRSPVSMALELATARRMLARETDTLSELFLRTMGPLRNEKTRAIVTLGRQTVLPVLKRVYYWQMNIGAVLSSKPAPLCSKSALQSSNPDRKARACSGQIGGQEDGLVPELTERQRVVLALIQENPPISRQSLADKLGINASAVQKHLDKLKAAGAIERIGGTRVIGR